MTEIHTCSYYCERPECVRRQRDELRDRMESAQQLAPSAPVGVEDIEALKRLRAALPDVGMNGWRFWAEVLDRVIAALAQQPAAVDEGFVSRLAEALTAQGWDVDPDGDGSGIAQLRTAALAAQQQGGAE